MIIVEYCKITGHTAIKAEVFLRKSKGPFGHLFLGGVILNNYGKSAIRAVELMMSNIAETPRGAWDLATREYFGEGTSSQCKGCPRSTFIGLCESGLIVGIKQVKYLPNSKISKNKEYAVRAVGLLRKDSTLATDKKILWNMVLDGVEKKHNSQLDVVLSLWNNNLII